MEDWVDADCAGKAKGEGHCQGLRDDEKGADFLLREFVGSPVHMNMISTYIYAISNTNGGASIRPWFT